MSNVYITPEEYATAEQNGIGQKTLNRRVRGLGWSKERAMTEPIMVKRDGFTAKARANGISKSTYQARIYVLGWDKEKAATTPPRKKGGQKH